MWPFNSKPRPMTPLQRLMHWADMGDIESLFTLGLLYNEGKQVPRDEERALVLLEQAAEAGAAMASYMISTIHLAEGRSEMGMRWLERSARQGLAYAQALLGVYYSENGFVPRDPLLSATWWTVAYDHGFESHEGISLETLLSEFTELERATIRQKAASWLRVIPKIPLEEHAGLVGLR